MASIQDIEKLKRNVNETWEETFRGVDRTSAEFDRLVQEFVDFVGDWKEFSDIRRDRLADYITDLGDVSSHWQEINQWVEENSDTLGTYVGSLSDIRDLFYSISAEVGGLRRQTLDRINLTRSLSRLAESSLVAVKQEGGLTDRVVTNLRKKGDTLTQQYYTQLKILGIENPNDEKALADRKAAEQASLRRISNRIELFERLQRQVGRLNAAERAELRVLREQAQYHLINIELLDKQNKLAVEGLQEQLRRQQELFRIQRRGGRDAGLNAFGANRVQAASKLLGRVGLSETADDLKREYGEWLTKRVEAQQYREAAQRRVEEGNKRIGNLVSDQGNVLSKREQVRRQRTLQEQRYNDLTFDRGVDRWRSQTTGQFVDEKTVSGLQKAVIRLTEIEDSLTDKYSKNAREIAAAQTEQTGLQKSLVEAEKTETVVFGDKFGLLKRIGTSLKDSIASGALFAAVWGVISTNVLKVDDLSSNLKQRIGSWETSLAAVNTQFASAADWLQTATELTDAWHINPVTIFTGEEIGKMAEAKNLLGLTAQQAQALGIYSKLNNQTSEDFMKSMNRGFQSYNQTNRTAIAYGNVQREVLRTSEAIRLSYGGQGEALAKAANAALSIGMSMQQVESVMNNLIQFESSIEAEMQAQLLTGRQLNLAKAREYALNNDIAGVVGEITRQGIDAAWWGSANRIQQENMAKALGMSREEMARMLVTQQLQNGASAKAIAANMKISEQEVKQMSAMDTIKKSIEKMAQAFAPLIRVLGIVADLLSLIIQPISAVVGWVVSLGGLLDRLTESTSAWANVLRAAIGTLVLPILGRGIGMFTNLFKTGAGLLTGMVSGARRASAALLPLLLRTGKIGTNIKAWAVESAAAESGFKRIVGNKLLGNVKVGRKYRSPEVLERARRIKMSSQTITPEMSKGPSKLGGTFNSLGKNMGTILKGAAAMLVIAGALWVGAKAGQEFATVEWEDLGKAGAVLLGFAGTAWAVGKLLSKVAPELVTASLGLAVFGASLIPVGYALNLAAPAFDAFANIVTSTFGGIVDLLNVVTFEKAAALTAVGGGFAALALGVGSASLALATFPAAKLAGVLGMISRQTPSRVQNLGESEGISKENISATAQEIVIKQAEVQASSQQISIEQKAADLSRIEKKMDDLGRIIRESRPDWNWLEFGQEAGRQIPWMFAQ